jgi:hypothetical protein
MKKIIYIIGLSTFFARIVYGFGEAADTVRSAPGITIETAIDNSEIYIGDLINYRLTIIYDSGITLTPPPIGANLGAFDVKDYQVDEATKLKDGRIKLESRFKLTTFTTGDYIIPPIPVKFVGLDGVPKFLISEPTPIRVKSLLTESSDTADIRDLKGPIEPRSSAMLYYILGGALAALLGLAGYIYWRMKKKRAGLAEAIDLRNPWEIAFEELAILKEKGYLTGGKFKQYYIELTEILRKFLGRMYDIPALDMTTEEFLGAIAEKNMDSEIYARLKSFLGFADLVKFAKLIPEETRAIVDFDEGTKIVDDVRRIESARFLGASAETAEMAGESHV